MRDNCTRFSLYPRLGGLDRAVSFQPIFRRIGESQRRAHGPECARAIVADAGFGWLPGTSHRDRALFGLASLSVKIQG